MKLFSIIVPVYNKSAYIGQTIASVCAQEYSHWECIVVDDGSTDNSKEIIESIALSEPRIKAIFKSNSGVADSRNIGLEEAVGDFVVFLDGDDLFDPKKLSLTLEEFEKTPNAEVVYSDYNFVSKSGDIYSSNFRIKLNTNNVYIDLLAKWDEDLIVPIHCCCYRRDFLINNNIRFDSSLKNKEDWDFLLQVALCSNAFYFIDRQLVSYLITEQNRSSVQSSSMIEGTDQLYCKHYNQQDEAALRAIAYNLRYRIIRNSLIRLLGKREPDVKLSLFAIAKQPKISRFSRLMIPKAILRSMYKLATKR